MQRAFILIVSLLALLTVQWWMSGRQHGAVFQGELYDSDSYMRLVRVGKLIDGGGWYDDRIARANAPHGHSLHWTRPLDVLLLSGAAVLSPALGWRDGLHQAGVWISPLLHILTLLALLWAAGPLFKHDEKFQGLVWLGLLFPLQLFLDHQFAPGRADHHGLILLLFVCALGALVRAMKRMPEVWAAVAGLFLGLLLWVSVEGLLAALMAFTLFGLRWLSQGRAWARGGLALSAAMAGVSALGILAEHRFEQIFMEIYDQISIVYLVFLILIMIAFAAAARISLRWLGLLAFAAVPLCQFWLFPNFFHGPLAGQDPLFQAIIFEYAGETIPLRSPSKLILYLGPAALALPHGLWQIRWPAQDIGRWPWVLLTGGLVLYLPFAIMQLRWVPYVSLLALPGYTAVLVSCLKLLTSNRSFILTFSTALARTVVVLGFAFALLLLSRQFPKGLETQTKCRTDAMAQHLADRFGTPQRILSYMTVAPAILYRSRHDVIATPYFRNAQGGRDALAFFGAQDPKTAYDIATGRRIDLVLTCPADRESRIYDPRPTLPIWLRPMELPPHLRQWRLYKVWL
ncbi:MAG: hypothetical protein QF512_07925 [Alphaproteobacteria bacterium]|nr:hypothetical protein [Alphaproteobacteria bacterium]